MTRKSLQELYRIWIADEGYLGIHLILGFIIALFGLILFVEIADEMVESEDIRLVDSSGRKFTEAIVNPALTRFMVTITFFGEIHTVAAMSLLVGLLLYWKGSHRRLYTFAAIMGGGGLLNGLLKLFFARNRPDFGALIEVHGFSFPSGHAMGAALFFGGLGYVLFFSVKRNFLPRFLGVSLCVVAALLIGFSRIYLGVHYTSDVLAGFIGGITWTAICIFSTEAWVRWRNRRTHV
jgi:membrane-associated phospholipid phosphatase